MLSVMNTKALAALALGAALALTPVLASAQTALSQLGALAGTDTAPISRSLESARTLAAAPAPAAAVSRRDPFACVAVDGASSMRWNAKQAAILVQTCLNHDYPSDGSYVVRARARADEGLDILILGVVPAGDPVAEELREALDARGGLLLGFRAILNDLATSGN